MRNLKKFLALVLAMLMVVSAAATVSAFDDVTEEHDFYVAIQDLVGKEIVQGMDTEGTTFAPEGDVTRLQAAIMFARAITGETDPTNAYWNKGLSQFSDVTAFQYAVTTAVNAGIINGMGDGTYNPDGNIQFIQALKMAVCALGYGEGLTWGADGMEYYNVAVDLGLTAGLDYIAEATKPLNRGEFAQLVYNMIYADLADGTGSIAYNVFKVGYVEPVEPEPVVEMTTFIITATDEQTAYEGMDVAEGDYVGIQQLVNGVAAGDMIYVPVEVFGFEGDEDEAAFLHAYNLANYDAETGAFDYVEATGDSWKIYSTEVTVTDTDKKYNRFKHDNSNYYAVDELTGSAIRNEVVIYNTLNYALDEGNKQLFLNANGQVMHKSGEYAILEAVYSVSGDIVSYRVLRDDADTNVLKGAYLSVSKATALYGAVVDEVAESYTIVDAADLKGAYELTVFDDDNDGVMDRAYYTPVYMSVYEGINGNKVHQTYGPFINHDEDATTPNIVITGMEDLTAGDLFVYTYNVQLHDVTVLDVLELQEGTVKRVNTTNQSKSNNYYSTITLTDGTALTLYNYDKASATATAKLGAEIKASGTPNYTKDTWMNQLTATFDYVNDDALLERLEGGSLIRYYARNNVIVFAETYNIEDVYERVILKEIVDADLDAVYADVYRNGKVEEIAITMIGGKPVSEISWIKLSSELNALNELAGKGNIFKISPLEEGYQLSAAFTEEEADEFGLVKMTEIAINEKKETIEREDDYAQNITIYDNIAEIPTEQDGSAIDGYNKYNRLRTNEKTIWYFINDVENSNTDEMTVKVFSGEIEEGTLALKSNGDTQIYVDALGYGSYADADTTNKKSNYAGTASVVYVFNAELDECEGFGWGEGDRSIVYVSVAVETAHKWDYYEAGDAEELGLNAKTYDKNSYYKYSSSYVMDMYTGKGVSVFSDKVLLPGNFYYVNEDGYVLPEYAANAPLGVEVQHSFLSYGDLDFDTNDIEIKDGAVLNDTAEVSTLAVLTFNATSIKTSASDIKKIILPDDKATTATEGVECYYLNDGDKNEDGVFAIVAGDLTNYDEDFKLVLDMSEAEASEKVTVKLTINGTEKSYVVDEADDETVYEFAFVDVDNVTYSVSAEKPGSKVTYSITKDSDDNTLTVKRTVGKADPIVTNAKWGVQGTLTHKANVAIDKATGLGTINFYWGEDKAMADLASVDKATIKVGVAKLNATQTAWEALYDSNKTTADVSIDATTGTMTIKSLALTIASDVQVNIPADGIYMLVVYFETESGTDYKLEYQFAN